MPQLDAPERVRLDQVDEFPSDRPLGQLFLDPANRHGRHDALEHAPNSPRQAHIHLGDAKLGVAVGALVRQFHVVHANHLAAVRIDDLLVEQVLLYRQPLFIRRIELEGRFIGREPHNPRGHGLNLVVASHDGTVFAARKQQARHAIGLLGWDDKHLLHPANQVPARIECLGADEFCGVDHS